MFGFCLGLVLSEGRKQMNLKQTCLKQTCVWKGKSLFLSLFLGLALPGAWSPLWAQTAGFAYVANQGSNDVSAYTINATTGALTPVTGSPFAAGVQAFSVTVSPNGQFAYVANFLSSNISAYTINATTGALTSVTGSPFAAGSSPISVTVSPNGQFAYASNFFSNDVSAYTINATTGALTSVTSSPFAAGLFPRSVTVSPNGQFAYVANENSNSVSAYTINATTGALTPVTGSPFAAGLNSASVTTTRGSCGEGDDAEGDGDERGDDGHKGSFRFHAQRRGCQPSGEMDFEEPDTGEGMRGSADALTVSGSTAIISGPGTLLDGTPVYYTAVVLGNQPVIGANLLAISWVTSTGSLFHTSGVLTGGYIAVHPQ